MRWVTRKRVDGKEETEIKGIIKVEIKRRGAFSLVELLIVALIIALLAAMLLLMTGSSTDRAEATKIIGDLRGLKSAGTMFFFDNNRWPQPGSSDDITILDKYCDRPMSDRYIVEIVKYTREEREHYLVGVTLNPRPNGNEGIKNILDLRAREAALVNENGLIYQSARDGDRVFVYFR